MPDKKKMKKKSEHSMEMVGEVERGMWLSTVKWHGQAVGDKSVYNMKVIFVQGYALQGIHYQ